MRIAHATTVSTLKEGAAYASALRPDMNVQATVRRRLKPALSPLVGRCHVAGGFIPRRAGGTGLRQTRSSLSRHVPAATMSALRWGAQHERTLSIASFAVRLELVEACPEQSRREERRQHNAQFRLGRDTTALQACPAGFGRPARFGRHWVLSKRLFRIERPLGRLAR